MAKKKRPRKRNKKTNPTPRKSPRRRRSARRNPAPHRRYRKRRNPAGRSVGAVIAGAVVGTLAAGAVDYGLAGMEATATPTRRALIGGVVGAAMVGGALMTDGMASDVLLGTGCAFGGVAGANGAKALSVAIQAASAAKATPQTTTTTNADGSLIRTRAVVPAVGGNRPAALEPGRRVSAVVPNTSRLRALVNLGNR